MYDIDVLERQWQRYRRRRLLHNAAIVLGIILLVALPTTYVAMKYRGERGIKKHKQLHASSSTVEVNRTKQIAEHQVVQKSLQPNIPSLSAGKASVRKPKIVITVSDRKPQSRQSDGDTAEAKQIRLQVTDAKSRQVVKEIEARFPETQDYDDAIYLAKYYYEKHRYAQAETWAMRANSIDSSQEESWLLYGKAKAKQGHRAAALRILQAYYDQSGSMRAKMIIDRIRRGKRF